MCLLVAPFLGEPIAPRERYTNRLECLSKDIVKIGPPIFPTLSYKTTMQRIGLAVSINLIIVAIWSVLSADAKPVTGHDKGASSTPPTNLQLHAPEVSEPVNFPHV